MKNTKQNLEKLNGSVDRVTFHSNETGFCVLRVKVKNHRDLLTVIGSTACITAGESIECMGGWVNDKKHGLQFKAEYIQTIQPNSLEGIEKYLSSGLIKGIGPHFAKILIKSLGEEVFTVIENNPERLVELSGIGPKRKNMIVTAWAEQKEVRNIMVFLKTYEVSTSRAVRIYKTYGNDAINVIKNNPYQVAVDIVGIGFKTADSLAAKLGIPKDSINRARAGIKHILQENASNGHCAIEQKDLINQAISLLEIPETTIIQAFHDEVEQKNIVLDKIGDQTYLFLKSLYQAECLSAQNIARLKNSKPPWGDIDYLAAVKWAQKNTKITLSLSQQDAVITALKEKVLIITGGPGVGKTTVINTILKIVLAKKIKVLLCAPTGRAAKRLTESTAMTAKTIHRLLEYNPRNHAFLYDQNNKLPADMIVIDEASMIDIVLFYNLIKAIPSHAALLIVGDIDQLPSIGPGAVLADLISSKTIPVAYLTEIFRQAASSKIIVNAHRINKGEFPLKETDLSILKDFYFIEAETPEEIKNKLITIITKNIPKSFQINPKDIQILAPMNRGELGTRALNVLLQETINPNNTGSKVSRFGTTFSCGDKIIQNVNNYDKEVFNGDIGVVTNINIEDGELEANFEGHLVKYSFNELDEIALAYATSIHKSQGSEYPAVIIPISIKHYMLLARNLLYTAITRGKKLVVIVGQKKALAIAIKNASVKTRITNLQSQLCKNISFLQ